MAGLPRSGVSLIAEGASSFVSDMASAGKAVAGFDATTEKAGGGVSAFGKIATGALLHVGEIAVDVMGKAAQAVGKFVGDSISAAGDFQANMAVFASVSGDALAESGKSLEDFSQLFMKLGAELPVSTAEVQQAAIELAKGGIDPATIAAGGLRTALDLAAAGGIGLASSAEIMAKQMGVWVDATADAGTKAAFLAQTADLLSQAANATTSDVEGLAVGLANAGGTAKIAGLDFRETVTGLSLLAPGFSSASDAGTSFKTFLSRLIPSTKPATAAMIALGLATEDGKSKFYDAQGSFIGLSAAAQLLQEKTAGLSEAQKLQAFQTIFGADAIRAAAILVEQGAAGYDRMTASLAAAGTVQAQAAARQQGFNTALDNAKGSLESLQITIGSALLPILSTLLNTYITPGINTLTTFANAVFGSKDAFAELSPALQSATSTIQYLGQIAGEAFASFQTDGLSGALATFGAGLTTINPLLGGLFSGLASVADFVQSHFMPILAGIAAVLGTFLVPAVLGAVTAFMTGLTPALVTIGAVLTGGFVPAITAAGVAFSGLLTAAIPVVGTLALVAGAGVLLYQAWTTDFAGIQGIAASAFAAVTSAAAGAQSALTTFAATPWGQDIQAGASVVANYFANEWPGEMQRGIGVVQAAFSAFGSSPAMQQWGAEIQAGAGVVAAYMANEFPSDFRRGFDLVAAYAGAFNAAMSSQWADMQRGFGVVSAAVQTMVSDFQRGLALVTSVISAWAGDVQRGATAVQTAIQGVITGIQNAFSGFVSSARGLGADIISGVKDGILSKAGEIASAAAKVVTDAIQAAKNAIWSDSPSKLAAKEVGEPIPQGVAVGIVRAQPELEDTASAMATAALAAGYGAIGAESGTSTEAASQIGLPFVKGIVKGVADSLSLIKGMARHLSKQLTEDMQKVAQEAADAFKAVLQAGLEADVGFSGTKLSNFKAINAITDDSGLEDAAKAQQDAQAKLDEAKQKGAADEQALNQKTAGLEAERAKKIADLNARINANETIRKYELAQVANGQDVALAADREKQIAALNLDTSLTAEQRAAKLAAIEADIEAKKAARIAEINKKYDAERIEYMNQIGSINADYGQQILAAEAAYQQQNEALQEQLAALQKALDLAKARVNVERELDKAKRDIQARAREDLAAVEKEANVIRVLDPKAADDYYKLRSQQILAMAKLEQDRAEALAAYQQSGRADDQDRFLNLDTERTLLEANQAAERALFAANAKESSPYAGLTDELANLQNKLTAELQRDQGFYNLTDRNNHQMRDKISAELDADRAAIAQVMALMNQIGDASINGVSAGVEGGEAGLVAAIQAALLTAQQSAQATLGIHSPSTVLADTIGEPMIAGITKGFLTGQKGLERSMAAALGQSVQMATSVMPTMTQGTVTPAMSQSQIANSTYNQQSFGNIGTFNAGGGITRSEVQSMIRQALNESGRLAYARKITR